MLHSSTSKIAVSMLAAVLSIGAGAARAAVQKQVLGTPPQGTNITVSLHGQHVAWQSTQGSRAVMVVDGVAGPPFDELLLGASGGTVAFSDDGSRYAYFGRNGGDYSLIVDGKELAHGPYDSSRPSALAFSPGGKHVYFLESDSTAGYRLVMDGKPGPWSGSAGLGPAFSPDDEHYAYNGPERANSNVWFTVIDGKQHDFVGNGLQYTGDDRLIGILPTSGAQVLTVGGLPVIKGASIGKVWVAPAGPHFAAAVQPKAGDATVLYLDGKPVADCTNPDGVIYSSDGKHYAAACSAGTGRDFVVIDGKKGQEYTVIDHIAFAPHSATAIYVARNSQYKTFVIVGGQEFGPYGGLVATDSSDSGLAMSQTGGHYAFASEYQVGVPEDVVFDGKQTAFDGYEVRYKPVLSADGSRYAFAAFRSGSATGLVVDGKLLAGVSPIGFRAWPGDRGYAALVLFSPDGKHIAYVSALAGHGNMAALFVDGRQVFPDPRQREFPLLAFTPDGRHLVWKGWVANPHGPDDYMLYIDGKATLQLHPSPLDDMAEAWQMESDGTLQFLTVGDDGEVLRYRVTPSSGDGVESLLANAGR